MGCHGSLNALRVANAYIDADPKAVVLLVSVELCSLHLQYGTEPSKIVSHALFADGAGAIIATRQIRSENPSAMTADESNVSHEWSLRANGSLILPDSQEDMGWQIGDHGFEMTLSPRIPELIGLNLRPWITEWLRGLELGVSDIGSWAIHPGGPKILKACARALQLSRRDVSVSEEILSEHGNMSSSTLLFILQRMRAQNMPRPCVAMGFGPGLCFEASLWG